MRSSAKVVSLASLVASLAVAGMAALLAPGCSNQGEGDVCNRLAGNDDCTLGFECSTDLNTTIVQPVADSVIGRCCLPVVARSQSTAPVCMRPPTPNQSDAAVPTDTDADVAEASVPDSATEPDASTVDASDDGG